MPIFRLEGDDISNAKLVIAQETDLELESHLEDWLESSPWALAQEPILWIGRQTSAGDEEGTIFPDLLGVDAEGNLVIVELKKNRAPREVVAQLLEYAVWANELSEQQIHEIAKTYFETRDEFKDKTFQDTFRKMFEVLENDELPSLNQGLRLFIVAEEIPTRIARVCRFLRTSHRMDVICITVSTFQTESDEVIVSMQTVVGDEDVSALKTQKRAASHFSQWSRETERQIVWETVLELTEGHVNVEFDLKDVRDSVLKKHPNFNPNTVGGILVSDTVNNDPAFPSSGENKYWRVKSGVYRLNDSENDKMESDTETNQVTPAIKDSAQDR